MFSYWNVAGYDPGDPIILHKGQNKEMYIAAVAPVNIQKFQIKVNMIFNGIQVEYPIPEDSYDITNTNLPIHEGEEFQCRLDFPVLSSFPLGDGMLVLTFYGQDNLVIAGGAAKFPISQ